jgi:hypothetical protein
MNASPITGPLARSPAVHKTVQEHILLSTDWFQEQIRECFNQLIASNTIKLNQIGINKLNQTKFSLYVS